MQFSHSVGTDHRRPAMPVALRGAVLDLASARAADPDLAGAKAANLARAAAAGLPVLPGFVLPTDGSPDPAALREAWERLTRGGGLALVVRSSSTVEDAGNSSMAGQFRSVLGVKGWTAFERAIAAVLESAGRSQPGTGPAPMAVLVQPELTAARAGVLFGVDPVTGDRRRLMIEAVPGSPEALVGGTVTAARYLTTRRGRLLEGPHAAVLGRRHRHRVARIARRAERVFGGPQDIEWAFDRTGHLWLLQSRPVTAAGHVGAATGPLLGPGPASETFPEALRPLEIDLWVAPLRRGIVEALQLTRAVSHRRLAASPVLTTVGGRVAVDLELLGAAPARASLVRALDPRRPARRVLAAWRVGRLRASLPDVVAHTLGQVDRHLVSVPSLRSLSDEQLVLLLDRLAQELVALHAGEVLAGMLGGDGDGGLTAAGIALAELAAGRAAGWPDEEIIRRHPVVVALTAPQVGARPRLPEGEALAPAQGAVGRLGAREALRLRARWAQELGAYAAIELGERLANAGRLPMGEPELVAWLTLAELRGVVEGSSKAASDELALRMTAAGPPLPATFRLTTAGEVMAVVAQGGKDGGRAAGGGRGVGQVRHTPEPGGGGVLVVETLSPELAAALPGLAGLVSETGSTLSHLAILAREYGVPTVVGVSQARQRFPAGAVVVVDGMTGEVELVTEPQGENR